ncbi:aspartyl/glutamyl-tRNA(Asn/Gln) amidotransferase subunit C, partial [Trichinella spiralis]
YYHIWNKSRWYTRPAFISMHDYPQLFYRTVISYSQLMSEIQ